MSRYDFSASGVKLRPRMQNDAAFSSSSAAAAVAGAAARIGAFEMMTSSHPQPPDGVGGAAYNSLYSSAFFGGGPGPSVAPYGRVVQSNTDTSQAYSNKLYLSQLVQDRQEMVNRRSLTLKRLYEAALEADSLRRENNQLHSLNADLNNQLNLLIHASIQKEFGAASAAAAAQTQRPPFGIVNGFHGLSIDDKSSVTAATQEEDEFSDQSQTSVVESSEDAENVDVERFSLPKSISVRSNGYVKVPPVTAAPSAAARARSAARSRIASKPVKAAQKVYVRGDMKEQLELEVYNQGMFKTELCNKWQESGDCPYKDHCQFAHGVEELRPVIRHPRYKTEVCRMVLAGDACPYGHRCHFRHALTEEEKQLAGGNIKLNSPIR